jgi:hypothetical protein
VEWDGASYIECEQGHILVAVVDIVDYGNSCFSGPVIQ